MLPNCLVTTQASCHIGREFAFRGRVGNEFELAALCRWATMRANGVWSLDVSSMDSAEQIDDTQQDGPSDEDQQ